MAYALLGIRGLGGEWTSNGVDEILEPFAENADYLNVTSWAAGERAVAELADFNGKIVIVLNSLGWQSSTAFKKYLLGKDVCLVTLDPAQNGTFKHVPLVSTYDSTRHLNIWQHSNGVVDTIQKFGPVEGAFNVQWKEPGHAELDDREGVQELARKWISDFLEGEKPVTNYKLTPRIALEVAVHEGLVQEAYRDSKGIWTWSIGVTDYSSHKVQRYINNPQTIERCIEVYIWLLDTKYLPAVERAFQGRDLTEAQRAAALSFHWNTGSIERASWVRSWLRGDIAEARTRFMLWNKPPEIIGRRAKERDLFFDGKWTGNGSVTHFPVVGANGRLSFGSAKRLDISKAVKEAIDAHYAPALPVPTEPVPAPPDVILGDLDAMPSDALAEQIRLSLDLVKQATTILERRSLQYTEGEKPELQTPAIERGFSSPETKETNMALTGSKSLFRSKTIIGLLGAAVSIFVPQLAPIVDILTPDAAALPPETVDITRQAVQDIVQNVSNIIAALSLLFAGYGRKVATQRIE